MNDDFLKSLRAEPPRAFLEQLKRRLDAQPVPGLGKSRSTRLRLLAVLCVAGTGLAIAALLMVQPPSLTTLFGGVSDESTPVQSTRLRIDPPSRPAKDVGLGPKKTPKVASAAPTNPSEGATANGITPAADARDSTDRAATADTRDSSTIVTPRRSVMLVPELLRGEILAVAEAYAQEAPSRLDVIAAAPGPAFTRLCDRDQDAVVVVAIRPMNDAEFDLCYRHQEPIIELNIGYQAFVFLRSAPHGELRVSPRDLYLALAKRVPARDDTARVIDNPYSTWNQINPALANERILIMGPALQSARGKLFTELALEVGCDTIPGVEALARNDAQRHADLCTSIRTDGVYREVYGGSTDLPLKEVLQSLGAEPKLTAVLQRDALSLMTTSSRAYPLERPVFAYLKQRSLRNPVRLASSLLAISQKRSSLLWLPDPANVEALKPMQHPRAYR